MGFALFELHNKHHILHYFPKVVQRICILIFTLGILFFVSVEAYIMYQGSSPSLQDPSSAIVLGAQLQGKNISRLLRYRLEAAVVFAKEYPDANIIVSGGKGQGESISEASAMKAYLVANGVAENRILIEDKSRNTQENLKFSMMILKANGNLQKNQDITIITNSFHMARAKYIAEHSDGNIESYYRYPAKSDLDLAPVFYFREFFAFCKDVILL